MKGFLGFWTFFIKSVTLVRESEPHAFTGLYLCCVAPRHCLWAFRRERGPLGARRVLRRESDSKPVQGVFAESR